MCGPGVSAVQHRPLQGVPDVGPRDVMFVVTAVPRLAEDMQDQADQPLVDSEDKVGAHISRYSVPGLG